MIWEEIVAIVQGPQARTLGALILIDIVLGIASAIRSGEFEWREVARFYQTMILPYLLGYVVLAVAIPWLSEDLLGRYTETLNAGLITAAWLAIVGTLVASIADHGKALWSQFPPETP